VLQAAFSGKKERRKSFGDAIVLSMTTSRLDEIGRSQKIEEGVVSLSLFFILHPEIIANVYPAGPLFPHRAHGGDRLFRRR
jgi:hypothetical protein